MFAIATVVLKQCGLFVCLSVCVLHSLVCRAKMAKPIEVPLGLWNWVY